MLFLHEYRMTLQPPPYHFLIQFTVALLNNFLLPDVSEKQSGSSQFNVLMENRYIHVVTLALTL